MKTQLPENYPQVAIWRHVMQKEKFMRAEFKKERIKLWHIKIMKTVTLLQDVQS